MKVLTTFTSYEVENILRRHVKGNLGLTQMPGPMKVKLRPIKQRRKHPCWSPIEVVTLETNV